MIMPLPSRRAGLGSSLDGVAAVAAVAASGVFCGLQVTDLDESSSLFSLSFYSSLYLVWPSVSSRLENSFLAVH